MLRVREAEKEVVEAVSAVKGLCLRISHRVGHLRADIAL